MLEFNLKVLEILFKDLKYADCNNCFHNQKTEIYIHTRSIFLDHNNTLSAQICISRFNGEYKISINFILYLVCKNSECVSFERISTFNVLKDNEDDLFNKARQAREEFDKTISKLQKEGE